MKIKNLSTYLLRSFLIFFILVLVVLIGSGYLSLVIVLSDSMEPTIPRGSLAIALKTNDYTEGDIILFNVYCKPVLHRIVGIEDVYFRTKGDDNTCRDPWRVPTDAVRGKLITAIPLVGHVFWALKEPVYFATFVTLMYITLEIRDWKKLKAN